MKSGEKKTLNQSDQNEFINSIQSSFKNTSYNFDTLKINVDISSWIHTHKILKKDFKFGQLVYAALYGILLISLIVMAYS